MLVRLRLDKSGGGARGAEQRAVLRNLLVVNSYRHPGTILTDHNVSVPLDHGGPDGERIEIFAREVVASGGPGREERRPL